MTSTNSEPVGGWQIVKIDSTGRVVLQVLMNRAESEAQKVLNEWRDIYRHTLGVKVEMRRI